MFAHGSLPYLSESSELHVHLLNIDLFPWSLSPIFYTGLAQRGEGKHLESEPKKGFIVTVNYTYVEFALVIGAYTSKLFHL